MERLSQKMKLKFQLPEIEIIDFKEALIFAFLGILKVRNETSPRTVQVSKVSIAQAQFPFLKMTQSGDATSNITI